MRDELRESQAQAGNVPRAFDVFLSHNGRDKPVVERIARRLRDGGIEPWLDIWHLTPGGRWQEELAAGLAASRACAVFIGSHDLGNWELQELGVALDRAAKERDFRLFPVLLPGLSEPFDPSALPPFLATRTWVDFREGWDEPRRFQGLVNAVRGVPLGPAQPAARADDRPPYRGLETFDEEHADVFFGREGDVQRLLEKLKASRFLAVLGPSGSGKSSLVRAGLVPALRRGAVPGSETWQICLLRPGARPLTALAAQLAHVVPGGAMQRTLDGLAADERTLHLAVALTLADTAPSARVVLVVDQLEEAFTLARDETERERFLANLVYAASVPDGQAVVVTTMRADFYPRLAAYPEAAQLTAAHQALVAPLDEEGLRQAIEEPARRVGLELEEGLVDTILEDVEHQSGALPLLEHALLELWRRRRGTMLTLEAYRETGGVGGALARRADGVFSSFTPEQQEVARRTFLRLTQPGEGTEDTRRRARLGELASTPADSEEVDAVVRALVDARMLTTGGGGGGDQWVDVSHEALIRGWPRLRSWLDDDRAGLRVHRRLTEATEEWERLDRDAGTLFRGARLVEAVEWRRRNEDVLNPLERDFLDASAASAKREQRQAQRRVRWTIAGMTLALLLIGAGALVAVHQRSIAAEQRDEAVSAANVARAANAVDGDPIAAVRLALDAVDAKRTPDATRALRQAVGAARLRKTLVGNGSKLWAADATADGTRAVTADDRGLVRIWDLKRGRVVHVLRGHHGPVYAADLSRDGRFVVTGGDDGTVRIWNASSGKQIRVLHERGPVHAAAFSPDGSRVVSGGVDRLARIWRTSDGRLLRSLRGNTKWIEDAAFSRDGHEVATAGGDGATRVWDTATGRLLGTIRSSSFAASVAFGPGDLLATGDDAGLIRVRGAAASVLRGHADTVWGLDFDGDGRLLASASGDRSARLWELDTGQTIATLGPHPSVVLSATFTDRGRLAVDGGRGWRRTPVGRRGGAAAGSPARPGRRGRRDRGRGRDGRGRDGRRGRNRSGLDREGKPAQAVRRSRSGRSRRDLLRRQDRRRGRRRRHGAALARRPTGDGPRAPRGRRTRRGVLARRSDPRDGRCRPPGPALGRRRRGTGRGSARSCERRRRRVQPGRATARVGRRERAARRVGRARAPPRARPARAAAVLPLGRVCARRTHRGRDGRRRRARWPTSSVAAGSRPPTPTRAPSRASPSHPTARRSSRRRSTGTRTSGTRPRRRLSRRCVRPADRSTARRSSPTAASSSAGARGRSSTGATRAVTARSSTGSRRDACRRRSDGAADAVARLTLPRSSGTLARGDGGMRRCGSQGRLLQRHQCWPWSGWGCCRARSSAAHRPPERARPPFRSFRCSLPALATSPSATPGTWTSATAPMTRARTLTAFTTSSPAPP